MDTENLIRECEYCSKALFNPLWGEYKCSVTHRKAKDEELKNGCAEYKNGKPGISKGIEEE